MHPFDEQDFLATNLPLSRSESLYSQEKLPVFPRRRRFLGHPRIRRHSGKLASYQAWRHFEKHRPSDRGSQMSNTVYPRCQKAVAIDLVPVFPYPAQMTFITIKG